MKLTQPEIIQILRRRKNLNQGTLGARAFNTSFESGRTKIKNIELGRQQPTSTDLEKMAIILEVPVNALSSGGTTLEAPGVQEKRKGEEVCLTARTLALFPGLAPYLEMLNKAVAVDDSELINHISDKIVQIFQQLATTLSTAPRVNVR